MYSLYEYFWFFFIYAFLGWCLEVCFCTVETGKLVNRGFLNGPLCPIYGFGMAAVLLALTPVKENLFALYFGAVILTSVLELITGYVMKKLFSTTWWDYSDMPFNLGGYICLKFSLIWGIGGVIAVRIIHPLIYNLVGFIPLAPGKILLFILTAIFIADIAATVVTVAQLNKQLYAVGAIGKKLREYSNNLSNQIGTNALEADEKLARAKLDLEAVYDIKRAELADAKAFGRARILKAFPNMQHTDFNDILAELKSKAVSNRKHRG